MTLLKVKQYTKDGFNKICFWSEAHETYTKLANIDFITDVVSKCEFSKLGNGKVIFGNTDVLFEETFHGKLYWVDFKRLPLVYKIKWLWYTYKFRKEVAG